jgi:hypothetical protein
MSGAPSGTSLKGTACRAGSILLAVHLGGCGAGASSPAGSEDGGPPPSTGGGPGAASMVTVRLANFVATEGVSGRALDIYDDLSGASVPASAQPLVANLAYGAVSGYVHPHVVTDPIRAGSIALTALPAGSPPTDTSDALPVWEMPPDDGSHPQLTVLLTYQGSNLLDTGPLEGIAFSSFVEKGDDPSGGTGPAAPAPPGGQGEFLVSTQGAPRSVMVAAGYFFVDDSCTPPLNGDPNMPGVPFIYATGMAPYANTTFSLFPASPGSHPISIAPWTDVQAPMCSDLTQRVAATTVTVAAGQQIFAFVYGTSATDIHLVTAPIAN